MARAAAASRLPAGPARCGSASALLPPRACRRRICAPCRRKVESVLVPPGGSGNRAPFWWRLSTHTQLNGHRPGGHSGAQRTLRTPGNRVPHLRLHPLPRRRCGRVERRRHRRLGRGGLQRRGARGRAELAGRARGRPPLRRRHRDPRQVRGHGRDRPGQARSRVAGDDPRRAPHVRQEDPGRPRRARDRGRPAARAAGVDRGDGGATGRGDPAPPQGEAGGQRARHPARRRDRTGARARHVDGGAGRLGQARTEPQGGGRRHRDLPGLRGWRAHGRRRFDRAVAGGHRRRGPVAGPRGRRHRLGPADGCGHGDGRGGRVDRARCG